MLHDNTCLRRRAKPPPPSTAEDAVPSEGAAEGETSKKVLPPPTDRAGRSTDNSIASSRETLVDDGGGGGGAENGAGEGGGGSPVHAGIVVGGIAAVIKEALSHPGGSESPPFFLREKCLEYSLNWLALMPRLCSKYSPPKKQDIPCCFTFVSFRLSSSTFVVRTSLFPFITSWFSLFYLFV